MKKYNKEADVKLEAIDIANYFTSHAPIVEFDTGERRGMTHLKLQMLMYMCQAYSLSVQGRPLFIDKIRSWEGGPIIESLSKKYGKYSSRQLPINSKKNLVTLDKEDMEVVSSVQTMFGKFSKKYLINVICFDPPCTESINQKGHVVSLDSIYKHYYKKIKCTDLSELGNIDE